MNFYFAGPFDAKFELRPRRAELQATTDHKVIARWLDNHEVTAGLSDQERDAEQRRFATEDIEDVTRTDGLIFFPGSTSPGHGGRHTELGLCISLGHRILVCGKSANLFSMLPFIEVLPDWAAVLAELQSGRTAEPRDRLRKPGDDSVSIREMFAPLIEESRRALSRYGRR